MKFVLSTINTNGKTDIRFLKKSVFKDVENTDKNYIEIKQRLHGNNITDIVVEVESFEFFATMCSKLAFANKPICRLCFELILRLLREQKVNKLISMDTNKCTAYATAINFDNVDSWIVNPVDITMYRAVQMKSGGITKTSYTKNRPLLCGCILFDYDKKEFKLEEYYKDERARVGILDVFEMYHLIAFCLEFNTKYYSCPYSTIEKDNIVYQFDLRFHGTIDPSLVPMSEK